MNGFIKALYADLIHRIEVVISDIGSRTHHEDIRDRFIDDTISQLQKLQVELQEAFDLGILEMDAFAANNIYRFNRVHRMFKAIHSYRYLAVKYYREPEIFFFRVISKIYSEHRIAALPPIVSTISNHDYYYWAVPYFEIIALPAGEEHSLLNLPDMYHEIGHLLHSMFNGKSCEKSAIIVDKHFEKEIVRIQEEGLADHFEEDLKDAKYLWSEAWLEEFSCDLVGTYMTGGAYAWTNLKLLSTGHGSTKIYIHSQSHPADEARMRIIILMLDKLGLTKDKNEVEVTWNRFLKDTEMYKPIEYDLLFPQHLLEQVVNEFFDFYQNADLASYPELLKGGANSVAYLLNNAWGIGRSQPQDFYDYEMKTLEGLRKEFKL